MNPLPLELRAPVLPFLLEAELETAYGRGKLPTIAEIADKHPRIQKHLVAAYEKLPAKLRLPHKLGNYTVNKFLGDGGQARAVRAVDEASNCVLLKYDWRNRRAGRLRVERDLLVRIAHPNVRRCLGLVTDGPIPFLVLEYLDGKSLLDHAQEGALSFGERAACMRDVALAIDHIHRQEVIHHDIKPDNILVDAAGVPKLIDFGLAVEEYLDGRKRSGVRRPGGTFRYMAPEQILGKQITSGKACDIYSLGATLFHLVTGEAPRPVHSSKQQSEPHPEILWEPTFADYPGVSRTLVAICQRAMQYDPEQRYASAADMAGALADFVWWQRYRPKILLGSLSLVLGVAAALAFAEWTPTRATRDATQGATPVSAQETLDSVPPRVREALKDISADDFTLSLSTKRAPKFGPDRRLRFDLEQSSRYSSAILAT